MVYDQPNDSIEMFVDGVSVLTKTFTTSQEMNFRNGNWGGKNNIYFDISYYNFIYI